MKLAYKSFNNVNKYINHKVIKGISSYFFFEISKSIRISMYLCVYKIA